MSVDRLRTVTLLLAAGALVVLPDGIAGADPAEPAGLDVTVTPGEGQPGTSFTASAVEHGIGLECTSVTFSWQHGAPAGSGMAATFTVPTDAQPGIYHVTGTCDGDQRISRTDDFTVLAPPVDAGLTLEPGEGPAGTPVQATVTDCGGTPDSWRWEDQPLTVSPDGRFTVPDGASDGAHSVTVACGSSFPEAPFTVLPFTVTPTLPSATPGIIPVENPPSTEPSGEPVTDASTTVAPPTPPEQVAPEPVVPWWVYALFVISALLTVAGFQSRRTRNAELQSLRVRAVIRPGGAPTLSLREAPGRRTHAIRISVHSGTATDTIERGQP